MARMRFSFRSLLVLLLSLVLVPAVVMLDGFRAHQAAGYEPPPRDPYRPPLRDPHRPPRPRSLYEQEGTPADGYLPIDAAGQGPFGTLKDNIKNNWKWQSGGGSWSGVYMKSGWLEKSSTGDSAIDVEADVEMYVATTSNSSYYFHIGNLATATDDDLTAYPTGTLDSNAGMYIGLNLSAVSGIGQSSFEKDGSNNLTGRVYDAMAGTIDVLGRDISDEAFDLRIKLSWNDGTVYHAPDYFGDSPDGTISNSLWWLVNGGAPGSYALKWKVRLLPEVHQADGNYSFESEIVVSPAL